MTAARKPALHLVEPVDRTPEQLLAQMVPEMLAAEQVVISLRRLVAEQTQALAKVRGVKFIRPEHVRQEFGR